jgi:hypothetical protein
MLVFKARPRRDPAQREDLTESQKRIMRLMGKAMREVRDQIEDNEGLLMDALQHSSIDKVVALVTVEPWLAMQEELQDELQEELVAAGNRVKLPRIQKALATFRFDAPNKNASNFAVQQGAGLVTEVITSQRETIRNLVAAAQIGEGLPPKAMARQLKNTVGLTTQQAGWVRNFEERAISQSMAAGKTFDQALEGSQKATQRYHDKIHRYRTETIARTETLKASNAGRNEAWKQGVDGGYISPNAVKEWQAEGDACQICAPLNGEQVPLSESFPEGDPPRHPNCRCNVKLVDEIPADITSMTDEEIDAELDSLLGSETSLPNQVLPPLEQVAQLKQEHLGVYNKMVNYMEFKGSRLNLQGDPIWDEMQDNLSSIMIRIREAETKILVDEIPKPPVPKPSKPNTNLFNELTENFEYQDEQVSWAIQQWEGEGYRRISGALQEGVDLSRVSREVVELIETFDDNMVVLPSNLKLFRGQTEGLDNLQIGQIIKNPNFTATSTDMSIAGEFSKSSGAVLGKAKAGDVVTLLEIQTKQTFGIPIKGSSELEVLLERGLRLKVTGSRVEELNGVTYRIQEVLAQ